MSTVVRHSGDKAQYTFFNPAGTSWPATTKDVQAALALIGSWARTDVGIPVATYTVKGIAAIATNAEIDAGTDTTKIVTPAGLAHRMSKPEATETTFGMTRYANDAESVNKAINTRSITPKALSHVMDVRNASEAVKGTIQIATTLVAQSGVDDTMAMTPAKTKAAIKALVPDQATASETIKGLTMLATVQQAQDGVAREGVAISPYSFARANSSETKYGTVKLATASDMKTDTDMAVSSRRFRAQRASLTEVGTTQLTNVLGAGNLALAANAPVVSKAGDNMSGRLKLNGDDYVTRSELTSGSIQVGFICMAAFASSNNYGGTWAYCDGRSMNKNSNAELFARIGYTYGGSGDNFNLPNMNDIFPRGASGSRPAGTREDDTIQNITGGFMSWDRGRALETVKGAFRRIGQRWNTNVKNGKGDDWGNEITFDASRVVRTSHETRPKNMALWFIIRIK